MWLHVYFNREDLLYILNKKDLFLYVYVHSKWAISVSLNTVTPIVQRDRNDKNL